MSRDKTIREIDKAVRHLIDYTGPQGEWDGLLEEAQRDYYRPVAEKIGISVGELSAFFSFSPFQHMADGFIFEDYATAHWNGQQHSLIDAYLEHRGWRESPIGRRYLVALANSDLKLWEIVKTKPGAFVEVRPKGSTQKPMRVFERAASESLNVGDGLAARVIELQGKPVFTGAMLSLSPPLLARLSALHQQIATNTREMLDELLAAGEIDDPPEQIDAMIADTLEQEFPAAVFQIWAMHVYMSYRDDAEDEQEDLHWSPLEDAELSAEDSTEIQRAIQHHLHQHYRNTLDQPIPMLGDLSPRACAADPALRHRVIEWLEHLERSERPQPGMDYDFSWIWDELKLERG